MDDLAHSIDRRFEQVDRRFEQVDRRLDRIDESIRHLTTTVMLIGGTLLAALLGAIATNTIAGSVQACSTGAQSGWRSISSMR